MHRIDHNPSKLNPNAPPELSRFAFLIGEWRCDAKLKRDDGTWEVLKATREGHYILDGYAIADEYGMSPAGELLVLGLNLRTYDAKKNSWNMKWLNALAGTWIDLGSEELGGVGAYEKSISYSMKEPLAQHALTPATYTNISRDHFTWKSVGRREDMGSVHDHRSLSPQEMMFCHDSELRASQPIRLTQRPHPRST